LCEKDVVESRRHTIMMFATVLQGRQSTFYHILVIFIESVLQMLPQFQVA